jgi:uncharacterized membrane protein
MAESMKLKNDVGEFPGWALFVDPAMLYTTLIPFTAVPSEWDAHPSHVSIPVRTGSG